jgi:hypothetical protein
MKQILKPWRHQTANLIGYQFRYDINNNIGCGVYGNDNDIDVFGIIYTGNAGVGKLYAPTVKECKIKVDNYVKQLGYILIDDERLLLLI